MEVWGMGNVGRGTVLGEIEEKGIAVGKSGGDKGESHVSQSPRPEAEVLSADHTFVTLVCILFYIAYLVFSKWNLNLSMLFFLSLYAYKYNIFHVTVILLF
jgi:hypothetical protein